jgi:hypothetical protein
MRRLVNAQAHSITESTTQATTLREALWSARAKHRFERRNITEWHLQELANNKQ